MPDWLLSTLTVLGHIAFVLLLLSGFVSILVGLPGTVVIFVDALVFALCTRFHRLDAPTLLLLFVMMVISEVADNLLGMAAARKYGGTRGVGCAALVGGVAGGLLGSFFGGIAFAFLGSAFGGILGAFLGGFAGAVLYELRAGREKEEALRAGTGAVLGRALGILLKISLGFGMIVIIVWKVYFG